MRKQMFQEISLPPETQPVERSPLSARLPAFVGVRADAESILRNLRIAVIGAGSVGRNIVFHLARLMVGLISIVDPGRFKAESFATYQTLLPGDEGKPKASNAGTVAKMLSPSTKVFTFDGPVQALGQTALEQADVIFLATDNLAAEVNAGQRCVHLKKPLIQASVHGATLAAQVRFFANADSDGPCPACGFGTEEWRHVSEGTRFSCELAAEHQQDPTVVTTATAPTMSVSFLCSAAADLAMMELLRFALGLGTDVRDTLLTYCGFTHETTISPLTRNPDCRCDHTGWDRVSVSRPLAGRTLRELAAAAGFRDGLAGVSFTVDKLAFAELGRCACGNVQRVQRFVGAGWQAGRCRCGQWLRAEPYHLHRPVPADVVMPVVDRTLDQLGAPEAECVLVRNDDRAVMLLGPHDGKGI